ncbi:hypothetical protein ACI3LY_005173 [Candidozyma auris]|uniref:FAD-binding FR-type domain-containing protein n=2 Tax=Candidozyma auris TaxID=498019 RepID=A0AB36VZC6_CANAR|nr:hypothetical protein B9J08_004886 [[Candida] auris]PIS49879.1 hypothetical protein CJI97_004566 [[Candida] auris]QWW25347.1 hypothetical protein CA7LBN_004229 [[Candida] auris]
MRFSSLACVLTLVSWAFAAHGQIYEFYGKDAYQVHGCTSYLSSAATFCKSSGRRHDNSCFCKNKDAVASVVGCLDDIGKKNKGALQYYIKYCKDYNVTMTLESLNEAQSYFSKNAKSPQDVEGFNKTKMIDFPIKSNVSLAHSYFEAEWVFLGNFDRAMYYGAGALGYWALVFLVAIIANWSVVIFPSLRTTFNGPISKAWRKYITLPALSRKKKNDHQKNIGLFNCLVPSRMESIVVFCFFWLVFGSCAGQIKVVPNDPIFKDTSMALMRVVADRTGIFGTVLLPLLFLIGGRNNFLQWLTRWKFSTFIMYHRWIARIIVLLVFIHSVLYSAIYVKRGNYARAMKKTYIIYGILATSCGGLICFQGLLYMRRKAYEIFLVVHIILAIGWVVGAWHHLKYFGYLPIIYATIAVWAFDRFIRVVRMLWFGFPQAQVTLVEDETLRVVVPKPKHWKSIPGGHAWLYFCRSWYFWQSHPFTFLESTTEDNCIVFLCKVKKGLTAKLGKKLALLPGKTLTCRVSVEGSYGESCPVSKHSSAVFLAGGNGIPGIYSEIYDLAKRSANNSKQMLKLVWIIREAKSISWMFEEMEALKHTKIQTTIYITRPDLGGNEDLSSMLSRRLESSSSAESDEKEKKLDKEEYTYVTDDLVEQLREHFTHIKFEVGRPSIDGIVQQEIDECSHSAAFISCGHPAMVDDLRRAVVENIDKTNKRIDFFEQLQVWA